VRVFGTIVGNLTNLQTLETEPQMTEHAITSKPVAPIPPDDPKRSLAIARSNTDQSLPHIGLVGDTYTILLSATTPTVATA
jgi:hypothetical protein